MGIASGTRIETDRAGDADLQRPLRIVLAKPGLDGHNVGIKVVARTLRDAGFEVVYLGLRVSIEEIVQTVIQEDADLIGIGNLSGALSNTVAKLKERMTELDVDVPIVVGGTLVPDEVEKLKELGVAGIYGPGTSTKKLAHEVRTVAMSFRNRAEPVTRS